MLDPRSVRQNLDEIAAALGRRGVQIDVAGLRSLEERRKVLQVHTQELQNLRNQRAKAVGQAKARGEDIEPLLREVASVGDQLKEAEAQLAAVQDQLNDILMNLPNIPHFSVPDGEGEEDNVELRRWGIITDFTFCAVDHVELGKRNRQLDFDRAAKITGSRFVVMSGALARMHRALIQFMLDLHRREHGYEEVYVPYIVNRDSMTGTGQLPKFESELFALCGDQGFYLIPTAEVPVTNMVRDEMLDSGLLPQRYVCHTPCFRSEAGSYGKDTRGMIRQHQFEKVELVQIVEPDESYNALEELTAHAEVVLQRLDLPYRVVALCCGDLGFGAAKTYDLEVWLPGQQRYREISSCSNYEGFQARRLQARWRNRKSKTSGIVHTLNGSALAVGRTLLAIMENNQDEQGNIRVPDALMDYMDGLEVIEVEASEHQ